MSQVAALALEPVARLKEIHRESVELFGLTLCGHTGVGPGSVVAVYRCVYGANAASCAVFREGSDEGSVEAEVVNRLLVTLKSEKNND